MTNSSNLNVLAIERAYNDADNYESALPQEILEIEGMSGKKTRHFYNNLIKYLQPKLYLEIGVWKGSSFISAMYNNTAKTKAIAIDNWSQFQGPQDEFIANVDKYLATTKDETFNIQLRNGDCFNPETITNIENVDCYLYDGGHTYEDHSNALIKIIHVLSDEFVFIVDDWNWDDVRNGTFDGIKQCGLETVYYNHRRHTFDNSHTPVDLAKNVYWNGVGVFILRKSK
jgi:hypothetical protein